MIEQIKIFSINEICEKIEDNESILDEKDELKEIQIAIIRIKYNFNDQ